MIEHPNKNVFEEINPSKLPGVVLEREGLNERSPLSAYQNAADSAVFGKENAMQLRD